jgi:hypothetical protein
MSQSRGVAWACTLALMGAGCTVGRQSAAPLQAAAPVPPPPVCPESIAADAPLESDYGPRIQARHWWPSLSASEFAFVPTNSMEESFRQKLELAEGPVELLGLEERNASLTEGGAALVMARPMASGYCIINTWATWLASEVDVSLAGSWVSPDRRQAILLLKLELDRAAGSEETRWVVLGTDGSHAWVALGRPPELQLIAPFVSLVPKKKQLFLDVKIDSVNRLPLGVDGHFIQPDPQR